VGTGVSLRTGQLGDGIAASPRPARRRRRLPGAAFWFILPAAFVLMAVYLGPMLYALKASFTRWVLVLPGSENDPAGLENYADVLQSREFWHAVGVTITYGASSIACGLTLGTALALLLNLDFFWRSFFRSVTIIPMVITPAVIGIFWKLSAVAGKFALAPPPGGSLLGGTSIGVDAKSSKAEAARLYVLWITSPEIVRRTAMAGTAPARLSALGDAALVAKYPYFPDVKAALLGETFGYIPMKEAEQVNMMMADEANAACAKSKSPEQAAADLQDKVTQFMKRRGYLR
jgi:hypothetical protein